MATVLYIKASPMKDLSYSVAVADAFIEAYRRANPGDVIETLDVFEDYLPAFDYQAAAAKYKVMHGKKHSEKERRTWRRILGVIDRFKAADKYVFAVAMWNFSIPYRLKQYIDVIVQPGQTFSVNEKGQYEGLVKGKRAVVVYSRGGAYSTGTGAEAFDLQRRYLELILGYVGISDIKSIVVEPTLAAGADVAGQRKAEAIEKAIETAKAF